MNTVQIKVDRDAAREAWRKYLKHKHGQTPTDAKIQQVYHQLAKGRLIIDLRASILGGGFDTQGLPKLAVARADAESCWLTIYRDGQARFRSPLKGGYWGRTRANVSKATEFNFPERSFPLRSAVAEFEALLPHIPPEHRPKRGLQNYHLLWEAEWSKKVPVDPMLLRRIGTSDLYLVVAAWDLTEVERAVLASSLR